MSELGHASVTTNDGRSVALDWEGPNLDRPGTWVLTIDDEEIAHTRFPGKTTVDDLTGWLRPDVNDEDAVLFLARKVLSSDL